MDVRVRTKIFPPNKIQTILYPWNRQKYLVTGTIIDNLFIGICKLFSYIIT